jgi:hypothetical protein
MQLRLALGSSYPSGYPKHKGSDGTVGNLLSRTDNILAHRPEKFQTFEF